MKISDGNMAATYKEYSKLSGSAKKRAKIEVQRLIAQYDQLCLKAYEASTTRKGGIFAGFVISFRTVKGARSNQTAASWNMNLYGLPVSIEGQQVRINSDGGLFY